MANRPSWLFDSVGTIICVVVVLPGCRSSEENPASTPETVGVKAPATSHADSAREHSATAHIHECVGRYRFVARIEGEPHPEERDRFRVVGDLTIRDTTMEVALDCVYEGRGTDPWGNERAGFSAHAELDRREWGLRWNQAIETGGVLVANKVRVDVEVQFVRQPG